MVIMTIIKDRLRGLVLNMLGAAGGVSERLRKALRGLLCALGA